jgi:2-oxoglutarate dehydrogenase E2 component (dihydrolipoamide succinyltransferase)
MAKFELLMPKLGESIIEATITRWLRNEGDRIEEDDAICELATDKVDSEIPSPVEGVLTKKLFQEGAVVAVGTVIAIIDMDGESESTDQAGPAQKAEAATTPDTAPLVEKENLISDVSYSSSDRFYSPLVKSMAKAEGISPAELNDIPGTGKDGRVTKADMLQYLSARGQAKPGKPAAQSQASVSRIEAPKVSAGESDTIVEMDRMRKLIADHMVMSKQVSPHVTSFIEVDMTPIVLWRERIKDEFQKREGEKLTFTPIIMEAAARALRDFPGVNASVDGYNVILRKNVNIGMAAALPSGNLIVPVIRNADQKNLAGLARDVNDLAKRSRENKLLPDEIAGGTFTITNLGTFGSTTGSPIINQPQVAILGIGVIKKKPAVIETPQGDMIAIRHLMILSLAYDHRVVDGALGGMYLQRVAQYLEGWDTNRSL